jgi:hypothetical protein
LREGSKPTRYDRPANDDVTRLLRIYKKLAGDGWLDFGAATQRVTPSHPLSKADEVKPVFPTFSIQTSKTFTHAIRNRASVSHLQPGKQFAEAVFQS